MDLVSVIVPVYNAEAYLPRCIESIISQTYSELEIILVNDGSPDKSGEICQSYEVKDKRIRYIKQKNSGAGGARNTGLSLAKGKYILFVDADDWLDVNAVATFLKIAGEKAADLVILEAKVLTDGKWLYKPKKENENLSSEELLDKILIDRISNHVTRRLFLRSLWDGVQFPLHLIYQDLYVLPHVAKRARKIVYRCLPVYFYNRMNVSANTAKSRDFRAFNRYSKVLAYAEHEKVAVEMGKKDVIAWSIDMGLHESVKAFCIDAAYPSLSGSQKDELKNYIKEHREGIGKLSFKDRLLLSSVLGSGLLCRIYGSLLHLVHAANIR